MNLGKNILELLQEHEIVIIPGFGAFIPEYKPAEIDEESGKMTPPSKEISFNPKIRNNDGLLVGKVAESEQIPHLEAFKKIEEAREDILYRLDKGKKATLESLGVLFYGETREIQFEPSGESHLLLDAFGLGTTSLKDEAATTSEGTPQTEDEAQTGEPEGEENKEEAGSPATDKQPVFEPAPVSEPSFQDSGDPPRKKNRGWLWFLLILIPLVAAGIFVLTKEKKEPTDSAEITVEPPPVEKPIAEEQTVPPVDTTEAGPAAIPSADSVETAEKESIDSTGYITPDSTKFYLVGGSFKNHENAEKYFQYIKKEGFEPFHLGKQGNFYLVGIDIFDNEIEAFGAQYDFLDKYPESGVWVFNEKENSN